MLMHEYASLGYHMERISETSAGGSLLETMDEWAM
jgi:hypothetical protein